MEVLGSAATVIVRAPNLASSPVLDRTSEKSGQVKMRERKNLLTSSGAGPKEWARAFSENRQGEWWQRVVQYELIFDVFGKPAFEVGRSTPLLEVEYKGMIAMRDLANLGQKWVVWISPKGGMSGYPESRFCVGRVVKIDAGTRIDCFGICGNQGGDECLRIARKLVEAGGVMFDRVDDFEGLRDHPIGLEMADKEVWELLSREIKIDQVWEAIKDGRVAKNNTRMYEMMELVVGQMPAIRGLDSWDLQRRLEIEMAGQFGIRLMASGNHGGSVMGNSFGAFGILYLKSGMGIVRERKDGKKVCPCGHVFGDGETVCPKCGLKLKEVN